MARHAVSLVVLFLVLGVVNASLSSNSETESSSWPDPASSILSQIQEAEREFLAAAATGASNDMNKEMSTSDACNPNPCKNAGTCFTQAGGFFQCACASGWIGRDCSFSASANSAQGKKQPKVMQMQGVRKGTASMETAAAGSSSKVAENNMTVQSAGSSSTNDDYCSRFSPCLHGGLCQSMAGGSYKCICKSGWVGHDCALALDANVWGGSTSQ